MKRIINLLELLVKKQNVIIDRLSSIEFSLIELNEEVVEYAEDD